MPHITIEYSANLADHHDIDALVDAVHRAALDHGLPPLAGLRTRAAERSHFRIADGDPRWAFVAIACRVGPGRDADETTSFLEQVLDAARRSLAEPPGPLVVAWSIELTEIDPATRINRNDIRDALTRSTKEP